MKQSCKMLKHKANAEIKSVQSEHRNRQTDQQNRNRLENAQENSMKEKGVSNQWTKDEYFINAWENTDLWARGRAGLHFDARSKNKFQMELSYNF